MNQNYGSNLKMEPMNEYKETNLWPRTMNKNYK